MEALNAASTYLLTIWDMVKQYEKDSRGQYPDTRILDLRVVTKSKG
jgi:cyclic pyranopterin phosphate synthase